MNFQLPETEMKSRMSRSRSGSRGGRGSTPLPVSPGLASLHPRTPYPQGQNFVPTSPARDHRGSSYSPMMDSNRKHDAYRKSSHSRSRGDGSSPHRSRSSRRTYNHGDPGGITDRDPSRIHVRSRSESRGHRRGQSRSRKSSGSKTRHEGRDRSRGRSQSRRNDDGGQQHNRSKSVRFARHVEFYD